MNREGIDVSRYQPNVDWPTVKRAGIGFAYVQATYGETEIDSAFSKARVQALRRAGIPFGVYHFGYPSGGDGAREAEHFVKVSRDRGWGIKGDLPGALDLETSNTSAAETRKYKRDFVKTYRKLTGHRPVIYTGSFWRDFLGNPAIHATCRLWLAAYTSSPGPYTPRAWKRPFIWQYTGTGNVPGVPGDVDRDRLIASPRAFQRARLKGRG